VKKLTLALAAVVLAIGMSSTAMAQRIVVVVHGQAADPFWSVVKNGVDAAAKDMGITVEYRFPGTFDMVAMAQLIDAAVASNPDGIAVSLPDADALGSAISDAVAAGIPVVSMNSGSDDFKALGILAHVGQTEYEAGVGGGERMKAAGVTNAICFNQEVGNIALDRRCAGFAEGLGEGSKVTVLAGPAIGDPTAARNSIAAALNQNPDLDGFLTLGPTGADPALQALEEAEKLDEIVFGTFDLSPSVLEALRDGKMAFAIDQQQYLQGYLSVVILTQFAKYGVIPANVVQTGPGFVTGDNAAQVIDLSKQGIR
jgi:simple sugar transport system substrate-binding protein